MSTNPVQFPPSMSWTALMSSTRARLCAAKCREARAGALARWVRTLFAETKLPLQTWAGSYKFL